VQGPVTDQCDTRTWFEADDLRGDLHEKIVILLRIETSNMTDHEGISWKIEGGSYTLAIHWTPKRVEVD